MELDYNADTKGLEAMDEEESQSRTLFKINKVFKKNYKKIKIYFQTHKDINKTIKSYYIFRKFKKEIHQIGLPFQPPNQIGVQIGYRGQFRHNIRTLYPQLPLVF